MKKLGVNKICIKSFFMEIFIIKFINMYLEFLCGKSLYDYVIIVGSFCIELKNCQYIMY